MTLAGRLAQSCEGDPTERGVRSRAIAAIAAMPLVLGLPWLQVGYQAGGLPESVAALFLLTAGSMILIAGIAVSGRARLVIGAAVLAVMMATAALLAVSGSLSGPLGLLLLLPAVELWWILRSRTAFLAGIAAAAGILILERAIAEAFISETVAPDGWMMLAPMLWIGLLCLRLAPVGNRAGATAAPPAETWMDAAVLTLAPNGDVAAASARADDVLGLPAALLLGSGLFDRVHVSDRVTFMTAVADIRDGAEQRSVELRIRAPMTSPPSPDVTFKPFRIDICRGADETIHALVRSDETVAQLRAELARNRDEAEAASAAKNRFLASVSHELRTPLNAIIGFAEMMQNSVCGPLTDARQREYVGLIAQSGHHLLSLVNAILDVSKIEAGSYVISPEPFDFAVAAAMPLSIARQEAERKGVNVELRLDTGVGTADADCRAVQQMLINLLANAVKFTPEGGVVTLGARETGGRLTFWVNDTGIGIAPDDLVKLGKPFMQLHNDYTRQYEGTGLGLSLVKGLVQLHGGTLAIDSAPGEGTCVTVTLPARAQPEEPQIIDLASAQKHGRDHGAYRKSA